MKQEWVRSLILLAVTLPGIFWCTSRDYFTSLGLLIGMVTVYPYERKHIGFKDTRNVWAMILILVFGPANIFSALFGVSTTGLIYAFGYTLLVGVIANFIMGVGASRLMLRSVSGLKFLRNKRLYGGKKKS